MKKTQAVKKERNLAVVPSSPAEMIKQAVTNGSDLEKLDHFTMLYFGLGAVIVVLALAGFLTHRD